MAYDSNGNAIETITRQRFNDDSSGSTGALVSSSTSPKALVSFATGYFDAANRTTATVNLGRVSGDSYTRPGSAPSRSDTVLVTSYTYMAAGWPDTVTDPKGLITAKYYDLMGRVSRQIEAYDGVEPPSGGSLPTVTTSTDRPTVYTYDGLSHILTLQAVMPSGTNSQTTQYDYGVTTGGGSTEQVGNTLPYPGTEFRLNITHRF
jgi:hypothetical protein